MPASNPPHAWVLTNAPSPYQVELFSAVAEQGQVQLDVRFMRDTNHSGPHRRFPNCICRAWLALSRGDELRWHQRPIREVAFGKADVFILSGQYTSITFLVCALLLRLRRKPWAVWWERPRASPPKVHWFPPIRWMHTCKDSIRRWLLQHADLVIGIGSAAVREYAAQGVPADRLRMLPYCCDTSRYTSVPIATRNQLRDQWNWSKHLIFLFSGQLIPRKGVDHLIRSFLSLAETHPQAALLILGDGPDRLQLESMIPDFMKTRVRFLGHLSQAQLPEHFAAADVLAFPSRHDGWAVVINEACAAGLPIIATEQTGAAHDLVEEGRNGFRVPADDVDAFLAAMEWCITHREQLPEMGVRSRELIQPVSAEQGARTFAMIAQDILHMHSQRSAE